MEKRYQVFVSSTFADLRDERQRVIQTLMEMDCIPSGMELFPAQDEEQWSFIKRIIDDCDYYLLIIGGRYGSVSSLGTSYTEMEFDYAVEKNIRVIALVHQNPSELALAKSEGDPKLRERLEAFRNKVCTGRLVKFWTSAEELPGLVALSLAKTIKAYPAVGWVRANKVVGEELLIEMNELRKRNAEIQARAESVLPKFAASESLDLADFEDKMVCRGTTLISASRAGGSYRTAWQTKLSWKKIFSLISPFLIERLTAAQVKSQLAKDLADVANAGGSSRTLNDQDFQTISVQLQAYGLVSVAYGQNLQGAALFWELTKEGKAMMFSLRAVRRAPGDELNS